jgi:hypothetical protein
MSKVKYVLYLKRSAGSQAIDYMTYDAEGMDQLVLGVEKDKGFLGSSYETIGYEIVGNEYTKYVCPGSEQMKLRAAILVASDLCPDLDRLREAWGDGPLGGSKVKVEVAQKKPVGVPPEVNIDPAKFKNVDYMASVRLSCGAPAHKIKRVAP